MRSDNASVRAKKAAVNGAIGRLQFVGVGFGVVAKIEGGVVIIRGERSRELFDDAPGLDSLPFFVDFEQRRAGGGRVGENGVVEFGDAARAFAKQPRKAGHFVIEPLADAGGGFVARALAQIGQHRGVNRIGGRALAVPTRQFGGGERQIAGDDRAVGAALGHVQHRGNESDQQKREQGRDRRESEPFFAPLGAREASRQSREGVGGGGGGGHRGGRARRRIMKKPERGGLAGFFGWECRVRFTARATPENDCSGRLRCPPTTRNC